MNARTVCFLGGGGHASDVWGLVQAVNRVDGNQIQVVAIVDPKWEREDRFDGEEVELLLGYLPPAGFSQYFISTVGAPALREHTANNAQEIGLKALPALLHPSSCLYERVPIGAGSVVLALCSVHRGSQLGEHVYLSHGSLIGHDVQIGDYCSVLPGAMLSGDVQVGRRSVIGSGAVVLEGLKIGDDALVGAGAVVTRNVGTGETVVGSPARVVQSR